MKVKEKKGPLPEKDGVGQSSKAIKKKKTQAPAEKKVAKTALLESSELKNVTIEESTKLKKKTDKASKTDNHGDGVVESGKKKSKASPKKIPNHENEISEAMLKQGVDQSSKASKKKDKKAKVQKSNGSTTNEVVDGSVADESGPKKRKKMKVKPAKHENGDAEEPPQPTSTDPKSGPSSKKKKLNKEKESSKEVKPLSSEEGIETSESESEDEGINKTRVVPGNADKDPKTGPDVIEHTLFIANLPPTTKKSGIKSLFKKYGPILSVRFRTDGGIKILKDGMKKDLKSLICYVRYARKEDVDKACEMHGQLVGANRIRVCSQTQKQHGAVKATVFVGNISRGTTDNDLYDFFSGVGEIEFVRQIANKCVAYVCFKKGVSIKKALKLDHQQLNKRPLRIMKVDPSRRDVRPNKKGHLVKKSKPQQTKKETPKNFHGKVTDGDEKKKKLRQKKNELKKKKNKSSIKKRTDKKTIGNKLKAALNGGSK